MDNVFALLGQVELKRFFPKVEFDGASRKYKFNSTGESLNLKYSIMNFKEQRQFFEVVYSHFGCLTIIRNPCFFISEMNFLRIRQSVVYTAWPTTSKNLDLVYQNL